MKLKSGIEPRHEYYRNYVDREDYRYLRDIVDKETDQHYNDVDKEYILNNPLIEIDLDQYLTVSLNTLFWAEYSWRKINDIMPQRWVIRLNARVLNVESTYQKLYATLNLINNPFINRMQSDETTVARDYESQSYLVANHKRDRADREKLSSADQVNQLSVNQERADSAGKTDGNEHVTDNVKSFSLNDTVTNSKDLNSAGSDNQSLTADNSRNMNTSDNVNYHFDTPQNKQQDTLPDFITNVRGVNPASGIIGAGVAENEGFVTTQDRSDTINNSMGENRTSNTALSRNDTYNERTDENSQTNSANSNTDSLVDRVEVTSTQETRRENAEVSTTSGNKTHRHIQTSMLDYTDQNSKEARTNNLKSFYISKGLKDVTISRALREYRETIVNFENQFIDEFRDLFLGVF